MRSARFTPSPKISWFVVIEDDLAEMDANAEQEALLLGETFVEPRHALLDVDGHLDGGGRRAELGQHGVARAVDQGAAGAFNGRLPDPAACRPEALESQVFLGLHQAHKASEIGMQDEQTVAVRKVAWLPIRTETLSCCN